MTKRRKWILGAVVLAVALYLLYRGRAAAAAALGLTGIGNAAGPGVDPPAGYSWVKNTATEGGPWVLVKNDAATTSLDTLMATTSSAAPSGGEDPWITN